MYANYYRLSSKQELKNVEHNTAGRDLMNTHEAIISNLHSSRYIMTRYLQDLSDADLLVRPHPDAHHSAWQLGHLILSECHMVRGVSPQYAFDLPTECIAKHDKAAASRSQLADFYTKDTYLSLMEQVREATFSAVKHFSQDDLSLPGPEAMRSYAPKVGSVFLAIANHEMMHSGQLAVVRRVLGKPVVI
jgi:hypothetical protein